jgi:hypothetical protein
MIEVFVYFVSLCISATILPLIGMALILMAILRHQHHPDES